jgi:hypothetical protein
MARLDFINRPCAGGCDKKGKVSMKYITATLSGVFIFVCSGLVFGTLLAMICPKSWFGVELDLGLLSANIPPLVTVVIASAAATHTFRASLRARAFKLYRNKTKKRQN